jgi:predicted nucleic acid-binding protein
MVTGQCRARDALALIRQLPINMVPADEQMVFAAAHIKANHTLFYADAFVAAFAIQENANILTGDPEFHSVEKLVPVDWLQTVE